MHIILARGASGIAFTTPCRSVGIGRMVTGYTQSISLSATYIA